MTSEKKSKKECGKGHVIATTVLCKLQQWDRYRVPQNVFLFFKSLVKFNDSLHLVHT